MLNFLYSLDVSTFYFVNRSLQNPLFDLLMPFLTDLNKQPVVLALVLALIIWMVAKGTTSVRIAGLLLIPTILISDQMNSAWIKFLVERSRPCFALANVHLLVGCGSGYSFPSSHAVNNFAGAIVLSFFIPRWSWAFFGFAFVVAFSRVYVGVHYPSDVLGGALIGMAIGAAVLVLFHFVENLWHRRKKDSPKPT